MKHCEFDAIYKFIIDCGWYAGEWSHDSNYPHAIDNKSMLIIRKFSPRIVKYILSVCLDGRVILNDINSASLNDGNFNDGNFKSIFSNHLSHPDFLDMFKECLDGL